MPNLELREPEASETVMPIFRYDHSQIPNYFFDVLLPQMTSVLEIKAVIGVIRLLASTGDEEILTSYAAIGRRVGISTNAAFDGLKRAESHGFLELTKLPKPGKPNIPTVLIKITRRVNYKRL